MFLGLLAQFSVFDTQHRIRSTCAQEVSSGDSSQLQEVAFWSSFVCTVSPVFSVSGPLVRKLRLWLSHSALCLEQGGQEPEETALLSGYHVSTKQDGSVLSPALRALGSDYPWQRVGAGKEAAEGRARDLTLSLSLQASGFPGAALETESKAPPRASSVRSPVPSLGFLTGENGRGMECTTCWGRFEVLSSLPLQLLAAAQRSVQLLLCGSWS